MLHVLLILLKIIGIILALVLCLIFLILAVPIRYSFQMEKKEEETFQGRIKVTWFWALLYVKVSYIESVFDYRLRIAGYQILGNQESFLKRKEEKQNKKQEKQKKKEEKQKCKDEKQKENNNQKEELTAQALPESVEQSVSDQDIIKTNQIESLENQKIKDYEKGDLKSSSEKKSSEEKPVEKKADKKKKFFTKTKKTLHSAGKKVSSLGETIGSFKKLYAEYHGEELLRLAKKSIIRILKHILPRRLNGNLRFGFNDPATTGIVTGAAAIFYPKYQKHFQLEPDFQESCFEADCEGRGRIHPGFFLILVIQLLFNPDVRKCIKLALR